LCPCTSKEYQDRYIFNKVSEADAEEGAAAAVGRGDGDRLAGQCMFGTYPSCQPSRSRHVKCDVQQTHVIWTQ
jgi:hypothetical protein